jgi:hypothetical protein
MTLSLKKDVAFDPVDITLLCANTVMFETDFLSDLVEQFWFLVLRVLMVRLHFGHVGPPCEKWKRLLGRTRQL